MDDELLVQGSKQVSAPRGIWVPMGIFASEDLNDKERFILADIANYSAYWKTNEVMADFFHVKVRQLQNILKSLEERGYITKKVVPDPKTGRIARRYLSLSVGFREMLRLYDKKTSDLLMGEGAKKCMVVDAKKCTYEDAKKCTYEDAKKCTQNKKEKNKKEEKKGIPPISPHSLLSKFVAGNQELLESLQGWVEMRRKAKKPLTERALRLNLKKLHTMTGGDQNLMIKIVDQSVMNGWLGFFPLKDDRDQGNGYHRQEMQTPEDLERWAKDAVPDDIPEADPAAWMYEVGLIDELPGGDSGGGNDGGSENHGSDTGGVSKI